MREKDTFIGIWEPQLGSDISKSVLHWYSQSILNKYISWFVEKMVKITS